MRRVIFHPLLLLVARWLLGLVFVFAAIEKIAAPEVFAISVEAYKLIPVAVVNIFAIVIPWIELLCGIFLIGGVYLRESALILSFLLIVFVFAILSAMIRHLNIDCGCFGKQYSSNVGWPKVLEDLGLLITGLYTALASRKPAEAAPRPEPDALTSDGK